MICLFCKIVKKKLSAYVIGENKENIAILDVSPISLGHALIITKKHYKNIAKIKVESWNEIFPLLKKIINKIEKTYNPSGFNIITNKGEIASQSIFHFHLHVIPKYEKNKGFNWSINSNTNNQELDLEKINNKLKLKVNSILK